jgi:drug/metabolite transporter (DMT)-like permease
MRLRRWSAVLLGLLGALLVVRPGFAGFNPWAFLVLASTLMWGTSIVIVKRLGRSHSAVSIVAWMSIMMTGLSLPPALLVWTPPTPEDLLWLLLIGTLATLGHLTMTQALKLADATAVMTVDYTRLIWASLIGYFAFGEVPDRWTWAGGSLIFASGLYIIFREAKVKFQHS